MRRRDYTSSFSRFRLLIFTKSFTGVPVPIADYWYCYTGPVDLVVAANFRLFKPVFVMYTCEPSFFLFVDLTPGNEKRNGVFSENYV